MNRSAKYSEFPLHANVKIITGYRTGQIGTVSGHIAERNRVLVAFADARPTREGLIVPGNYAPKNLQLQPKK